MAANAAKVVTKIDGQIVEETLKVNILNNTDKDVKISLVGSDFTTVVNADNPSFVLPAYVKAIDAQFTAVAEGLAKDINLEKLGDTVLITGKTEFGTPFSHKLTLKDGPVDVAALTATATSSDATVVTLTFDKAVTVAAGQTITLDGKTGTVDTVSSANATVKVTFDSAVTTTGTATGTFNVVVPADTVANTNATTFAVTLKADGTTPFIWSATAAK